MTEIEWRARYAARLVAVAGMPEDEAQQCVENVELGPDWLNIETDSPEDAADDEMECWE